MYNITFLLICQPLLGTKYYFFQKGLDFWGQWVYNELIKNEVIYMNVTVSRIKQLAEDKSTTIRELAEVAGCSKSAMQRYIAGDRDIPTSVISGIANAFNVHPAYLMGWVDDKHYSLPKEKQSTESELSLQKKQFIKKIENMTDAEIERLEQILALVEKTDV